MGDEISVDEKAADSVMRRTALRRDFQVAKGYARESRELEGDEVLTVSTARVHNERQVAEVGRRQISTLVKQGEVWMQFIHDQEVDDRINDWGREHFKSRQGKTWQEVYREEFVKRMRGEVGLGLSDAFWSEKMSIFSYPFKKSKLALMCGTSMVYSDAYIGSVIYFTVSSTGSEHMDFVIPMASLATIMSAAYSFYIFGAYNSDRGDMERVDEKVSRVEAIVPNFQTPSIFLGSASLLLNSGKLIRLKQS